MKFLQETMYIMKAGNYMIKGRKRMTRLDIPYQALDGLDISDVGIKKI